MLRRWLARLARRRRPPEDDGDRGAGHFSSSRFRTSRLFGGGLVGEAERELASIEDQARLLDEDHRR